MIMVFIMFFMAGTMLYGLALFLPSIVSQLGFSPDEAQLLSVGPFAAGFFGERFVFEARRISQGSFFLFSPQPHARCSSDYYFCLLVRPLRIKRYHDSPYLTTCVAGFALYLGKKKIFSVLEIRYF
jgi:hypothetical protein